MKNLRKRKEGEGFSPVTSNPLHESDLADNKGLQLAIEAALTNALEQEREADQPTALTDAGISEADGT